MFASQSIRTTSDHKETYDRFRLVAGSGAVESPESEDILISTSSSVWCWWLFSLEAEDRVVSRRGGGSLLSELATLGKGEEQCAS